MFSPRRSVAKRFYRRVLFLRNLYGLSDSMNALKSAAEKATKAYRITSEQQRQNIIQEDLNQIKSAVEQMNRDPPQESLSRLAYVRSSSFRHTLPPSGITFTGRSAELKALHTYLGPLTESDHDQTPGLRSVVLWGLGGMGKSQLALAYAHQHKSSYKACFWIQCEDLVNICNGFMKIARKLGYEPAGLEADVLSVKNWLENEGKQWLLVLDGADMGPTPEFLQQYWPSGDEGSVLVTSQDKQWQISDYVRHNLEVSSLSEDDGLQYINQFMRNHGRSVGPREAATILAESGRLPLALHQMLSFMVTESLSAEEFLDQFMNSRSVDDWDMSTSRNLATFLNLAFKNLDDPTKKVLENLSLLDVNRMPGFMVKKTKELLASDGAQFNHLTRYSLINKSKDDGDFYEMHPQVKRQVILHGGIYSWARGLLEVGRDLTDAARMLCGTGKVSLFTKAQIFSFHASIISDSGRLREGLREFEYALIFSMRYVSETEDSEPSEPLALLSNAYNNVAAAHNRLGNFEEASRSLLQQAVVLFEERLSEPDNKRLAWSLFKLALVQDELGDLKAGENRIRAEELYFQETGHSEVTLTEDLLNDLVPYI
ncbi:tetratricopeptide repeat domain-containing protein [Colletotrichum costaricense]|uniref:Tetratricopeptide repeat domain-containing protein n=1 Tax=Colletotrichum costaricense TaxID=1209916 RepID=A0AAJ0E2J3_9PEZI|nr:tetratricopeptide repeat domain-containing protein [Colletotrichum costaricense]KAK1529332.1 tetratricopeptide repeat domain-containing protein [Colletotrichum costaricense]